MNPDSRKRVDNRVSLSCRLALWLEQEIEPSDPHGLEKDIDEFLEFAEAVDDAYSAWLRDRTHQE